jgi:hypothetical protein
MITESAADEFAGNRLFLVLFTSLLFMAGMAQALGVPLAAECVRANIEKLECFIPWGAMHET